MESLQPGSKCILANAVLFFCFALFYFFIFLVGAFVFCFLRIPVYSTLGNPGEQGEPRELKCVHNNR